MKAIQLRNGGEALVDDADWPKVADYQWSWWEPEPGYRYAWANCGGNKAIMHRLILDAASGQQVDHINGNGLDNRRPNLRLCTVAQNQWNSRRRADNTSGFKGVYFNIRDRKWWARIRVCGKRLELGRFDSALAASRAYDEAARKYHGEFARCNHK